MDSVTSSFIHSPPPTCLFHYQLLISFFPLHSLAPPYRLHRYISPNHLQIDKLDLATVREAVTSQLGPDAIEVSWILHSSVTDMIFAVYSVILYQVFITLYSHFQTLHLLLSSPFKTRYTTTPILNHTPITDITPHS
jgi:hypothetical protein